MDSLDSINRMIFVENLTPGGEEEGGGQSTRTAFTVSLQKTHNFPTPFSKKRPVGMMLKSHT